MKYVSPGVYVREIDLSLYVPALSSTIAAMVGTATKGPVNVKTFVSSVDQYIKIFGHPDPTEGTFMSYAALQYLRRGSQLYVVRVAAADAAAAEISIPAIAPALIASTSVATSFTIVSATSDKLKVEVTDARVTPSDVYTSEITIPAGTYGITALAKAIADEFKKNALLANWVTAVDLAATGSTNKVCLKTTVASTAVSLQILASSAASALTVLGFTAATTASGTSTAHTFKVKANSVGSWGNDVSIAISQNRNATFDIGVYEATPTATINASKGFYGYRVELHRGATLDTAGYVPDDDVQGNYIADVLGTATEAGRSGVLIFENVDLATGVRYTLPASGTYSLTGGTNGSALGAALNAKIIGTDVDPSTGGATGLQIFRNTEYTDINILMAPGSAEGAEEVLNEVISICEERADCIGILDTPQNYTVQEVVDWHNGQGVFSDHQAFNSSYAAMYYDWIEIFDPWNATKVWTPPCGHVAAVYAWTDYVAETWYAPAGFNRAHLPSALRVAHSPSHGERELMYGNQNAINPIVQFPKDGITIWGQRTLQRKPSALDRVNTRRLMNYIKKVISTAVRYLTFEPNDPITWRQFTRLVSPFMETVRAKRGIYEFKIICDETTNTPDLIDNNTMTGRIYLKPTKTAEVVLVDFVLVSTGARFEEALY